MTESILENARCTIAVDARGAITHIVNKRTGSDHIVPGAPPSWRLLTTRGSWTECPVNAADNRGGVAVTGTEAVVRFDGLVAVQGDRLNISLEFHFELGPDDDGVRAWYAIENRTGETVGEVWFPLLAAVRDAGGDETTVIAPVGVARRIRNPSKALPRQWLSMPAPPRATRGVAYPGPGSMGWVDASTGDEGLYVASHARDARRITMLLRGGAPGSFDVGFVTYPFVPSRQTYRSEPFEICPHVGDWCAGAERYARFAAGWPVAGGGVPWLRETPGIRLAFMKHQTGRVYMRYSDLVAMHGDLRDRGLERVPLLVFGWFAGGHDAGCPDFQPDDELGGRDELVRVLGEIRAAGGRIVLYANGLLIDRAGAYFTCICATTGTTGTRRPARRTWRKKACCVP